MRAFVMGIRARGDGSIPSDPLRDEVLDLIAAAPDNSWVQLNTNTFQSAWAPADLRQIYPYSGGVQPESPSAIIGKWGSIGWDSNRGRLVLWGGGHANIGLSEVYTWSCATRQWQLAFATTRLYQVDSYPTYRNVNNGNSGPISSHTYANNNYLPIIDRFYTGGGAGVGNGGSLPVWSGDTRLRDAGGYTLDLTLAGQGYVATATGENIKYGAYASVDLPGANAWKLRDWGAINSATQTTGPSGNQLVRIESGTAYAEEGGKDVLYWVGNDRLWRTVFNDDTPANDQITQWTGLQNARESNGAIAYSPDHQIVLIPNGRRTDQRLFFFVDLKLGPNTSVGWTSIFSMTGDSASGFIGANGLTTSSGIAYDQHKGAFVLWMKGRQPWLIYPPSGNPTPNTGWSVVGPTMDTGTTCPTDTLDANDSGVIGKFKYAPDLRCCVAVEGITNGNVWALKLAGWTDPRL